MSLLRGVVFHTLKGIDGYSSLNYSKIDVAKVVDITWRKRLFCIHDREQKFMVEIKYEELNIPFTLTPVIVATPPLGFTIPLSQQSEIQTITKRYSSQEECLTLIKEIKTKQKQLQIYTRKLEETICNITI